MADESPIPTPNFPLWEVQVKLVFLSEAACPVPCSLPKAGSHTGESKGSGKFAKTKNLSKPGPGWLKSRGPHSQNRLVCYQQDPHESKGSAVWEDRIQKKKADGQTEFEGRTEMAPKHTLGWSREVCVGNTLRSPMDHWGGQSMALDLFHQAA